METRAIIETFVELEEAFHFLDQKILEYLSEGWIIRDGSGVERISSKWRVGLMIVKGETN